MRMSTIALTNLVVPILGSYEFSEEDAIASIQPGYTSGTVTLPGPGSGHNPPNNGDWYIIADPQNTLNSGAETVTINGGGYKFLVIVGGTPTMESSQALGTLLTEGSVVSSNAALKCGISFTFDAAQQVWIVG